MMVDINNSTSLPETDEIALAEKSGISLDEFRRGSLLTKSWEAYYQSLLVDPLDYYKEHFSGRPVFRYVQTHPDKDHMSGLHRFFWQERVELLNFWDTSHQKPIDQNDVDWLVYDLLRGGRGPDGSEHRVLRLERRAEAQFYKDDRITILSPVAALVEYCDNVGKWNNVSYVLTIDYGGRTVLLAGDAEKPAFDNIQANMHPSWLRCDLLKAPHHGRETGYSEAAVDAMSPKIVVCSVGKKPDTDASDEYEAHGARVLSTRFHGTIVVKVWSDGEAWVYNHNGERIDSLPQLSQ